MKYLVFLVAVLPCVLCIPWVEMTQSETITNEINIEAPLDEVFMNFRQLHDKKYESATEEMMRREIFKANVQKIKEHNVKYESGEKSYALGINQFADLTHKEFVSLYTGHLHKRNPHRNATTYLPSLNVKIKKILRERKKMLTHKEFVSLYTGHLHKRNPHRNATTYLPSKFLSCPDNMDWRKEGYVTEVKNQGQCGSCWSFSATGSLEGQTMKKKGKLISLSEQQLVDCSGSFGNQGCNGGLMDQAFEYIKSVGGIDSEQDYPYVAELEDKCNFIKSKEKAEVTGFVDVESGSESQLKTAVCDNGPISVAIDASHSSFQLYRKGIYDEPECSSEQLDHGVLVVGYGVNKHGKDYWLIKNSWGTQWGEEGYVKTIRNKENQCGVATQASYPLV